MEYDNIYINEYERCNSFALKAFASIVIFTFLVWVLNECGIFVVKDKPMCIITIIGVVLLFICGICYLIQREKVISKFYFEYMAATILIIYVGVLYSVLTFHTILMFVFPALVFSIYGNKKLLIHVMSGTMLIMVISHLASYYFGVNPEEPFTTMKTIIVYGLLPKMVIYLAFMYAFIYETNHNNQMIKSIYKYAKNMHQTEEETIRAFSEMCESKSGQTGHHIKRVASYVGIMADELGIKGLEKESLVTASMMHDVGKLNIPSSILDKPGKLTDEEFAVIKKHTDYGYDLLKNSPGRTMEIAAQIALYHHERWDGKGYHNIAGEKIDYYSRIMAVADVFDALVSKRTYKEKWSVEEAYDEIVCQKGKQFDPNVVDIFEKCYPEFKKVVEKMAD